VAEQQRQLGDDDVSESFLVVVDARTGPAVALCFVSCSSHAELTSFLKNIFLIWSRRFPCQACLVPEG
jgi:hypothetical protein